MATATADRSRSIRFCKGCSKASCKRKHSARLSTQRTERRRKRRAQKNECVSFPDAAHAREPSRRRALVDELGAARRASRARANRSDRQTDGREGLERSEETRGSGGGPEKSRRSHQGRAETERIENSSRALASSDPAGPSALSRWLGVRRAAASGRAKSRLAIASAALEDRRRHTQNRTDGRPLDHLPS